MTTPAWPDAPTALPFGMRDIKLTRYTDAAATTLDTTIVDLPVSRTLSFSETEEFTELRGDDQVQATHGAGSIVEWELESGGISLEAWSVFSGGEVTESGTSPNRSKKIRKNTNMQKPYFKMEGQIISDSGGDVHCLIWRAKVTDSLEGEFTDSEFFLTSASGQGLGSNMASNRGDLYEFVQNETATPIPSLAQVTNLTASAPSTTTVDLAWDSLTGASSYEVQYKEDTATEWITYGTQPTTASITVDGLTTGTAYNFRVRGVDSSGNVGAWSNTANATTS